MQEEKEITVKVPCDYETLHNTLLDKGFTILEEYTVKDIYMVNKNINIKDMKLLDILKNCVLVRDIIGVEKELLYKYKEYDEKGNILKQGKYKCPIIDTKKAIDFMEAINYEKLIEINDKCIVYSNQKIELNVQKVNEKYLFIEIEDKPQYIDKIYNNVEEMINDLNKYDIPYEKDDYFVKKAQIILKEKSRIYK